VFREPTILTGYRNTIIYTVIGTVFSTALVMITAYPLSRPLPLKRSIMIFFVITMYFGGGLIPTYLVVQKAGLVNNMWALFLPGGVSVFNVIITRNFFETSIPHELYDSAMRDGADETVTFARIVLPLAKPIMAVMVIFAMVAYWNDWFTALIYLPDKNKEPLQLVLRQILLKNQTAGSMMSGMEGGYADKQRITELIKFSSIIVSTVPMLIFYPFVQKYFEKGLMAGAVKG
jgi:putative aldouronate transport system permease protein